jgi:hypothetical protein
VGGGNCFSNNNAELCGKGCVKNCCVWTAILSVLGGIGTFVGYMLASDPIANLRVGYMLATAN